MVRVLSFVAVLCLVVAAPAQAQDRRPDGAEYVASSRGQVYYPVWCDAWHSLGAANLRWFSSEADAERAGYSRTQNSDCEGPSLVSAVPGPPLAGAGVCTVLRIIDGDTLLCSEASERIRLLLIDAPESDQGDFGRIATIALQRLLPIGTVAVVELDVQERDRYGRILAYLHTPSGRLVNEELARGGFVVVSVIPPNVRHLERIRAAVSDARDAGRGLWAGSAFDCAPADHRAGRC